MWALWKPNFAIYRSDSHAFVYAPKKNAASINYIQDGIVFGSPFFFCLVNCCTERGQTAITTRFLRLNGVLWSDPTPWLVVILKTSHTGRRKHVQKAKCIHKKEKKKTRGWDHGKIENSWNIFRRKYVLSNSLKILMQVIVIFSHTIIIQILKLKYMRLRNSYQI